jgi:hypothetical protein
MWVRSTILVSTDTSSSSHTLPGKKGIFIILSARERHGASFLRKSRSPFEGMREKCLKTSHTVLNEEGQIREEKAVGNHLKKPMAWKAKEVRGRKKHKRLLEA